MTNSTCAKLVTSLTSQLCLQTNKKYHGPFSTSHCGSPDYRIDIPPEKLLEDYFTENVKTRSINGMNFFDGFITEYMKTIEGKS